MGSGPYSSATAPSTLTCVVFPGASRGSALPSEAAHEPTPASSRQAASARPGLGGGNSRTSSINTTRTTPSTTRTCHSRPGIIGRAADPPAAPAARAPGHSSSTSDALIGAASSIFALPPRGPLSSIRHPGASVGALRSPPGSCSSAPSARGIFCTPHSARWRSNSLDRSDTHPL